MKSPPSKRKAKVTQSGEASPKTVYIPYSLAFSQLVKRLGETTAEEIAAWVFMTPKDGGIAAYLNANEIDPPPQFFFGNHIGEHKYLSWCYRFWFKADDIATFEPDNRFITGKMLLERWAQQKDIPAADRIRIASEESCLMPFHPTLGLTQATYSDDADYAPLEEGLFSLTEVEAYEHERFGVVLGKNADAAMSPVTSEAANAEKVQAAHNEAVGVTTSLGTTNVVYWRVVLYSNIKKIDEHKKSSVRETIKYLRQLKDERLLDKGDIDKLVWIDDMGNENTVQKKTVSTATSTARNQP